jgi:hypothetical protein
MFDLNYTPICIVKSTLQPDTPGLYVTNPPKRVVRGREEEQLILFLTLSGQNTPMAETTHSLLNKAAESYYQTPGSATAALRAAIQMINTSLVERNQRGSAVAMKLYGNITGASLRGFRMVAAQAGLTHAMIITDHGCEHFTTLNPEATRLGTHPSPQLSFFQAEVGESSRLFFADQDSPDWEVLNRPNSPIVSIAAIQNKIITQIPSVFEGALVQLKLGSGLIKILPYQELAPQSPYKPAQRPITGPSIKIDDSSLDLTRINSATSGNGDIFNGSEQDTSQPIYSTDLNQDNPRQTNSPVFIFKDRLEKILRLPVKILARLRSFIHFKRPQINVDANNLKEAVKLSNGSMILIALGIPIAISTIALIIYVNKGQTQQSLYYTAMAQASVNEAQAQTDPQAQYAAWTNAVAYLEKAENYKVTELTQTLRHQAENAVDGVDKTVRLEYRAAITNSLPPGTQIGKIVATATELYLLDTRKGQVYRAILTGRGYELDSSFTCGPSPFIGALVDIAPLSVNNIYRAALLGVDENGTLLFCSPEKTPDAINLTRPVKGIRKVSAFAYDSGNLYLLDIPNNSLWIYVSEDGIFKDSPSSLTTSNAFSLANAIDLAVNGPDLYLLYDDGHLTVCTISYVSTAPTQCNDPATFYDTRPGREPNPMIFARTDFTQLEYVPPPDPSIYIFDMENIAVNHFSLKLNLHRVIKPQMTGSNRLPRGNATAFTVSPNRTIFVAFGNQVFVTIAP